MHRKIAAMLREAETADLARDLLAGMGFSKAEIASAVYALSLPQDHRYAQLAAWENGGKLPETYGLNADRRAELAASQGVGETAVGETATYDDPRHEWLPWEGKEIRAPKWRGVPHATGIDPRDIKEMGGFGSRFLDTDDRRDLIRAANAYRDAVSAHFAWWHSLTKHQKRNVRADQHRNRWQCPVCKGNCAIYDRTANPSKPEISPVTGNFALRCAAVSKAIAESIETNKLLLARAKRLV